MNSLSCQKKSVEMDASLRRYSRNVLVGEDDTVFSLTINKLRYLIELVRSVFIVLQNMFQKRMNVQTSGHDTPLNNKNNRKIVNTL